MKLLSRLLFLLVLACPVVQAQFLLPHPPWQPVYDLAKVPDILNQATTGRDAPDFLAYGAAAGDLFGQSICTGDINGDGYPDIIIGSVQATVGTPARRTAGAIYVWFGTDVGGPKGIVDAADRAPQPGDLGLAHGPNLKILGPAANSYLSNSDCVRVADVNGDGVGDIIAGANGAGKVYIVFGRAIGAEPFPAILDLSVQGSASVTISGAGFLNSLQTADVTGDGVSDILISNSSAGDQNSDRREAGVVYVVKGRPNGQAFPAALNLQVQGVGGADTTILGATAGDNLASTRFDPPGALGDVNGDGITDIVLGSPLADGAGEARQDSGEIYLILGGATMPAVIDLDTSTTSAHANTVIYGAAGGDRAEVRTVGDVNGDYVADLLLTSGANSYIVKGRQTPASSFPASIDLSATGSAGADSVIQGGFVQAMGDVNGDAIPDILGTTSSGNAFIFFGRLTLPASIGVGSVTTGTHADVNILASDVHGDPPPAPNTGFFFSPDLSGPDLLEVSAVKDVSGDGVADIILSNAFGDGSGESRINAGEAYIVFGRRSGTSFPATLDMKVTGSAGADVTIYGATQGDMMMVAGTRDHPGSESPGIADVIFRSVGASGPAEARSRAGEVYMLIGNIVGNGGLANISVQGEQNAQISDGGSQTFGQVAAGSSKTITFTIQNFGDPLTGLAIAKHGPNADQFIVSQVTPPAPVAGGATATFTVQFTPAGTGLKKAFIHIASNDSNSNPFDIALDGRGVAPEISVQRRVVNAQGNELYFEITDGALNSFDFGLVPRNTSRSITYAVRNLGNAPLTVSSISVANAPAVPRQPGVMFTSTPAVSLPVNIPPGGARKFFLNVAVSPLNGPLLAQPRLVRASVQINNNDSNEAVFDFGAAVRVQ